VAVSGQDIVNYLLQFKGTPYVWGGSDPSGFDCSGLMQYGFKHFGIDLNRTTYDQIGQGQAVGMNGLRPGDLVFFDTDKSVAGPDHVGIYMGDGKMFHTPRPGKSAEVVDITSGYYMDRFMGGRRLDGVAAVGGSVADGPAPQEQVKLSPEELAANYGWSFAFLNSIPDVKKIFDQAVAGTWTADKFQAALRDTAWWKKTSDTARQAQLQKTTDPATYKATMDATKLQVQMLASKMGAAVPTSQLDKISESVMNSGLDEDGIRQVLGQYVSFTKDGTLTGEAGMHAYTMKQFAYANGVSIDDQTLKNQAALVVKKLSTTQDFESQVREQAKSAYPGYAAQIDAGQNMQDIAQPYIQTMAKELEIPATSLNMQDPTIKTAMNGLNKDGKPTGKNLLDFENQLRNDPRWAKTKNAQDATMNAGFNVLQSMGLIKGNQHG
jgi:hypothetical protein